MAVVKPDSIAKTSIREAILRSKASALTDVTQIYPNTVYDAVSKDTTSDSEKLNQALDDRLKKADYITNVEIDNLFV